MKRRLPKGQRAAQILRKVKMQRFDERTTFAGKSRATAKLGKHLRMRRHN